MKTPQGSQCHALNGTHTFWTCKLPESLVLSESQFEELWQMHPPVYHLVEMYGKLVPTPRWQQAFGVSYFYTGRVNEALPIPPLLVPLLNWSKENVDKRLSGILVNWYDGQKAHRIGAHNDSTENLIFGTPIVTVSFGEERIFRLHPGRNCRHAASIDFQAGDGDVFIMPYDTNLAYKHSVPAFKRLSERRISVTLRALTEPKETR
jgi:alkylated DNA repair dioxygenase AlkB